MLEACGLVKRFGGVRAVDDVSFTVAPGEVLGYLGPNGSGKTTTMNLLTGLMNPSQGRVLFRGRDVHDELVEYHARRVARTGLRPARPERRPCPHGRSDRRCRGRGRTGVMAQQTQFRSLTRLFFRQFVDEPDWKTRTLDLGAG